MFSFLNTTSYSFEGRKEGEEVVIFLHRHWFIVMTRIALLVGSLFIPFIVLFIFGQLISAYGLLTLFAVVWSAFYMILWYTIFYTLTMYTLDTWIVTNMRIINSVQHGFFNRSISELAIDKIQDVSLEVEGAMATFLGYGDLKVQTAGSERHFTFEQTPNPQDVKDKIMHLVSSKRHEAEHEIGREIREELFGK